MPINDETRERLPTGSLPLDETKWSGDHGPIKDGLGVDAPDDIFIDLENNVWVKNPDGTFTNHGPASDFVGSGKPQGRRGKDRSRRRSRK